MIRKDLRDGIRTHTNVVHDGGREGFDPRYAEDEGGRDEEAGRSHDGGRDIEGANVDDDDDYDGTGAGDSGLETGKHTSACMFSRYSMTLRTPTVFTSFFHSIQC